LSAWSFDCGGQAMVVAVTTVWLHQGHGIDAIGGAECDVAGLR